jgi:hypothetical protein
MTGFPLGEIMDYEKYRFLGQEFLLWLWYASENDPEAITKNGGGQETIEATLGDTIVIENIPDLGGKEKITIKGEESDLKEAMLALKKGGMPVQYKMSMETGDQVKFMFTIKADDLSLSGLKCKVQEPTEKDEIEGAVLEKMYLDTKIVGCIDSLFLSFVRSRIAGAWETETVPKIRKWIERG